MSDGFTDRVRGALDHAVNEARMLQHGDAGTEHILLGLIVDGGGRAGAILQWLGITAEDLRRQIDETVRKTRRPPVWIQFSPKAKHILDVVRRAAVDSKRDADTEDVLLAIVRDGENLGARLLAKSGVYPATIRDAMTRSLEPPAVEELEPESPRSSGVFISYRRRDTKHVAGRIADWLAIHLGDDQVFMDVDSIQPGVNFREVIAEAIGRCAVLLAVIGPGWLTATNEAGNRALEASDDMVRIEVEAALERGMMVIPILVDGAEMPRLRQLPSSLGDLTHRNALQIRHESFRQDVNRLLQAIQKTS